MFFKIEHATKRFGGLVANSDVNIDIHKGEIIGLIGPNGAGKSTIFKSINGFNRIDEGEIYFKDTPISKIPTHKIGRMGIACTFQHAQLFTTLDLEESVLMGAYCKEKNKKKALVIAREMIKFVGLEGKEHHMIGKLNMYERKRAELAAALATQPELRKVNKELGITLFIVEHVLRVIMTLCDRIYVLEHGKLIAEGTPDEITTNELVIKAYLGEDYDVSEDK